MYNAEAAFGTYSVDLEPTGPLGVLQIVLETESGVNECWNYPFVRKIA